MPSEIRKRHITFSVSVLDRCSIDFRSFFVTSSFVLRYFFVRPSFHLRSVAVPEAGCNEEVTEPEQTMLQVIAGCDRRLMVNGYR